VPLAHATAQLEAARAASSSTIAAAVIRTAAMLVILQRSTPTWLRSRLGLKEGR
jgi:hypothetical protein